MKKLLLASVILLAALSLFMYYREVRYNLSASCARDADNFYNNWKTSSNGLFHILSSGFQNHYNFSLNKCFILTTDMYSSGSSIGESIILTDVAENKDYASYQSQGNGDSQPQILSCKIEDKDCNSESEFNNFVGSYMIH